MNEKNLLESNIKLMNEVNELKRDIITIVKYIKGLNKNKEEFENIINYYNSKMKLHRSWSKYERE